jgi:hypothetical protein
MKPNLSASSCRSCPLRARVDEEASGDELWILAGERREFSLRLPTQPHPGEALGYGLPEFAL